MARLGLAWLGLAWLGLYNKAVPSQGLGYICRDDNGGWGPTLATDVTVAGQRTAKLAVACAQHLCSLSRGFVNDGCVRRPLAGCKGGKREGERERERERERVRERESE